MKQEIYFDNSATTKPSRAVVQQVTECLNNVYGNPSSVHRKGIAAERLLTRARKQVAGILNVRPKEIVFTSSGTEANNLAIKGAAASFSGRGKHIITTGIEHPSVRSVCQELEEAGFEITYLPVDGDGVIDIDNLKNSLRRDTILVSTMYVNNEIGSVQPLNEIASLIKKAKGEATLPLWHVDAVQALGRMPLEPVKLGLDLVSISAHKVHGPKGTGALYVAEGIYLKPLIVGGGQERGLRSGTENVCGIVGFGVAVSEMQKDLRHACKHMAMLRKQLVDSVISDIPDCRLNGPLPGSERAAPHIVNISFPGIKGEVLVHWLEGEGIYISTGSACSSRKKVQHTVLNFLKLTPEEVEGAVRFSFCAGNTAEEVKIVVEKLKEAVKELRSLG